MKHFTKKFLIIPIFVLFFLVSPQFSLAEYRYFPDVPDGPAYYYAVNWMYRKGVINGYPDGNFYPDKCVNRVEFLKILFNALYGPGFDFSQTPKIQFKDTSTSEWYSPYLNLAFSKGIVEGYPDGTFKPSRCVNRAEAVKMALSAVSPLPVDEGAKTRIQDAFGSKYNDIDQSQWYAFYLNFAMMTNILGQSHVNQENLYKPEGDMPRDEVAETIYRLLVVMHNEALFYRYLDDQFESGSNFSWNTSAEYLQDRERYLDLRLIYNQLKKHFSVGNYPIAPPEGSCLDELPEYNQIFSSLPQHPEGKGVGACENSYMYCRNGSYFFLASQMHLASTSNKNLGDFDNLKMCDGSNFDGGGAHTKEGAPVLRIGDTTFNG